MAEEGQAEHIVLLPFMAQGHFIPFIGLALFIERRRPHCTITIASTPLNISSLASSLPPASSVRLAPMPFSPTLHGLPRNAESASSISQIDDLHLLLRASESLAPEFDALLSALTALHRRRPLLVIADTFAAWSIPISRARGIPHFSFATGGAFGTAAFTSLWSHLPHRLTDSDTFTVPGFPDTIRLHRSQMSHYMRAADGSDPWSDFLRPQIRLLPLSDALLCNTVEEIEAEWIDLLRRIAGARVLAVGIGREAGVNAACPCIRWLESRSSASVIYVSFGSMNTVGAAQMTALAEGLEASGAAFLWVVRPPYGFDMNGEFDGEKWLPAGFEVRMAEERRGLVVRGWAPQMDVLAHEATGGFVSHCGWNSVMESLSAGVPVIGWPVAADQFYNSIIMEEIGAGMEVARGVMGDVDAGKIEKAVRLVMEGEKGKEMRKRAAWCGEMIRGAGLENEGKKGSTVRAIDEIFEMVGQGKQN